MGQSRTIANPSLHFAYSLASQSEKRKETERLTHAWVGEMKRMIHHSDNPNEYGNSLLSWRTLSSIWTICCSWSSRTMTSLTAINNQSEMKRRWINDVHSRLIHLVNSSPFPSFLHSFTLHGQTLYSDLLNEQWGIRLFISSNLSLSIWLTPLLLLFPSLLLITSLFPFFLQLMKRTINIHVSHVLFTLAFSHN